MSATFKQACKRRDCFFETEFLQHGLQVVSGQPLFYPRFAYLSDPISAQGAGLPRVDSQSSTVERPFQ